MTVLYIEAPELNAESTTSLRFRCLTVHHSLCSMTGRFVKLKERSMDAAQRWKLIEQYKQGYDEVVDALIDIDDDELDRRSVPGDWTTREIVHHLADSEMTSTIRLRRLLAEDQPVIAGYNEMEFARRLYYDRPIDTSLEALRAARRSTATILERLNEAEWSRTGTHSESGHYGVELWLEIYAAHAHDHADQIRRARATAAKREE